jgi:drug/metabolite transporter (DMT)-like permease
MRTPRRYAGLFVLIFGVFILLLKLGNARVQQLFASDVVALIGAGLCFGAGFVLLMDKVIPRGE